jgi:hypothetical protein
MDDHDDDVRAQSPTQESPTGATNTTRQAEPDRHDTPRAIHTPTATLATPAKRRDRDNLTCSAVS